MTKGNQISTVPSSFPASDQPKLKAMRRMWLQTIREDFQLERLKWGLVVSTSYVVPILEVGSVFLIYAIIDAPAHQQAAKIITNLLSYVGVARPTDFTITLILAMTALAAIGGVVGARYLNQVTMGRLRIQIYIRHCRRLIDTFLHTNLSKARNIGKDRIINSVFHDCGALQGSMVLGLHLIAAIWAISLCLIGAAFFSWKLLIVGFILYALPLMASKYIYHWMEVLGKEQVKSHERWVSHLNDVLSGFERTKADGLEMLLSRDTGYVLQKTQQWRIDKRIATSQQVAILDGSSMAGILITLYFGVVLLELELSLLLALFILFGRLRGHVSVMTGAVMQIRAYIAPGYRYFELLLALGDHKFDINKTAVTPKNIDPIVLSDVSFQYHKIPVLSGINFSANKGDRILITGASGQGKSTLVEILCGLLPPNKGSISIAGQNFDEETFYSFRDRITLVTPSVYLFQRTLRDNLTMGRAINEKQLIEALTQAHLSDVVDAIDGGLDGDLGTNGNKLSLGQRQRVILARAFLSNPKLLLMDEATSNLNPSLEAKIVDNIQSFVDPDCIIIMIAHKAPNNFQHTQSYEIRGGKLIDLADASSLQHTELAE